MFRCRDAPGISLIRLRGIDQKEEWVYAGISQPVGIIGTDGWKRISLIAAY